MAALEDKKVAGLAKHVRESIETQEWDAAGYTEEQVVSLIKAAFSEPVRLNEMIRHTFVVGGGKKVRQKYDEKMGKFFAMALRDIGYVEDQAASTTVECAGSFKQQHDTDKDLKFVHIFPRVELKKTGEAAAEEKGGLQDLGSPTYLATACTVETFKKMTASKTQSWSQRRRLRDELAAAGSKLEAIEQKMFAAQALSPEEQEAYEVTSKESIAEKVAWLEAQLKAMVDGGQVTSGEKQQLLAQMETRADALAVELSAAKAEDKPKKAEKLEAQLGQVKSRISALKAAEPIRHPLKHEEAIKALRVAIIPLLKLEAMPGLRSMEEMKRIGTRPDMEAEVARLEADSRGWFEEDAEFSARCALIAAAAALKADKADKAAAAKKNEKPSSAQWETVGSMGSGKASGKTGRR